MGDRPTAGGVARARGLRRLDYGRQHRSCTARSTTGLTHAVRLTNREGATNSRRPLALNLPVLRFEPNAPALTLSTHGYEVIAREAIPAMTDVLVDSYIPMPNSAHSIRSAVFAACRKERKPACGAGHQRETRCHGRGRAGQGAPKREQRQRRVSRPVPTAPALSSLAALPRRPRSAHTLLAAGLNDLQERQSKPACDTLTSSRLRMAGCATMGRCRR